MPFVRAGQLARPTPTARPDDPLGLVAENLRASHYGTIPVLDRVVPGDDAPAALAERNARVLGLVDERDLAGAVLPALTRGEAQPGMMAGNEAISSEAATALARGLGHRAASGLATNVAAGPAAELNGYRANGHAAAAPGDTSAPGDTAGLDGEQQRDALEIASLTASTVMRRDVGIVPAAFSLHNTLLTLDRYDSLSLPVVDAAGCYRGMISRSDVVAALGRQVRPPQVGGMATPLGVWLTTGSLAAGAPPLGLFLSGVLMASCFLIAHLVLLFALVLLNQEWAVMFSSGRLGATSEVGTLLNFVTTVAEGLLFLGVLRLLPLAGIHAAEHQTVWAIERGLPLTPEYVARMPRAHPRCGTNLMALGILIRITFQHLPEISSVTVLTSLICIYLFWRNFGTFLQERFTTRPATRRQLESGIKAGRELLEKYQEQPHVATSFGQRLFSSGLLLSAGGMILMLSLYSVLEAYVEQMMFPLSP